MHSGGGYIKVSRAAAISVGQRLAVGPPEYQEGAPSLGPVRKFPTEEGGVSVSMSSVYRAVVQSVLLKGAETWVLLAEMVKILEGIQVGFLPQVMGKTARQQWYIWTELGGIDGNYQVITLFSSGYWYFPFFVRELRKFSLPPIYLSKLYTYAVISVIYIG